MPQLRPRLRACFELQAAGKAPRVSFHAPLSSEHKKETRAAVVSEDVVAVAWLVATKGK